MSINVCQLINTGKVRDVYNIGHNLLLIRHSDRVSSFDKIWCEIQDKGKVLNSTSVWWFERTRHIIPNHYVWSQIGSIDMVVKKCKVFPIEFVVRGYITGNTNTSLWTHYNNGKRTYCGIEFPDGLKKNQKLVQPVITPTTKGDTDDPISLHEIVSRGLMTRKQVDYCASKAMELYKYGSQIARGSGLILVDTKYEFGINLNTDEILLVDEVHTCDSSRYWKYNTYDARFLSSLEPENFDKDLVRRYVKSQCDPYATKPSEITIPSSIKDTVRKIYLEFYNILTGYEYIESENSSRTVYQIRKMYFEDFYRDRIHVISSGEDIGKLCQKLYTSDLYYDVRTFDPYTSTKQLLEYLDKIEEKRNYRTIVIVTDDVLEKLVRGNITNCFIMNCKCEDSDNDNDGKNHDEQKTVDSIIQLFRM